MENNTDISDIITGIIEYFSETPNSFAKKLGYPRSQTLYDILNKKSMPSFDFFYKLKHSEFSEHIDLNALFTDNSCIIKDKKPTYVNSPEKIAAESHVIYKKMCPECQEKEKRISRLEDWIDRLTKKLASEDGVGQKRKAG